MPGYHFPFQASLDKLLGPRGGRFPQIVNHGTLSLELYTPRRQDPQTPHSREKLYAVVAGRGQFYNDGIRHPFGPGGALFVPAGVELPTER